MIGSLTINAVGDISLGDHPVCVGHGIRSTIAQLGADILGNVSESLRDSDITIGNLETVASDVGLKHYWLPSYEMRGQPSALAMLRGAGIDTLGVANNHAMQHGLAAFHDTISNLESLGFNVIGVDGHCGEIKPHLLEHNGVQACLFSVSMRPDIWTSGRPPYSLRNSGVALVNEVRELRARHRGFLICSLHWGLEFLDYPGPEQVSLAHDLVDAGVDVLLGHHSHVLQPVERYKSGIIFYSLGNFVFDLWRENTKFGVIVKICLSNHSPLTFGITPVVIDSSFCVQSADSEQAEVISSMMAEERLWAGTVPQSSDEYERRYSQEARITRRTAHKYFLNNVRAYSPNFVIQSLARTALRRLTMR